MQSYNLVAIYDTQARAQAARSSLIESGLDSSDVRISTSSAADETSRGTRKEEPGFFEWLFGTDVSDENRDLYRKELHGERAVVSVRVSEERAEDAEEILERFDPVDVRSGEASGMSAGATDSTASAMSHEGGEQVIPIVKEELNVGKRVEERRSRIHTYAVETPVERDVHLREERVVIERRPASGETAPRAATQGALQDRDIEVVERREVPVVDKQARVVEEVVVQRQTRDRVEKVADTVRETRVEVEEGGAPSGTPGREKP
jgi:stress response protein YsnF